MKKLYIFLSAIFGVSLWFSFAANPSILNYSYETVWNDVKIYWVDNSNWWNVDISVQNPTTQDRLHFGTAKISDQMFVYTKQREWDQKIWMIPDNWWDEVQFTIEWAITQNPSVTRTVIPAVPKTWPSGNVIWIIIATFVIFGGYIYIKKRADI
jgi:hypothetical protein